MSKSPILGQGEDILVQGLNAPRFGHYESDTPISETPLSADTVALMIVTIDEQDPTANPRVEIRMVTDEPHVSLYLGAIMHSTIDQFLNDKEAELERLHAAQHGDNDNTPKGN